MRRHVTSACRLTLLYITPERAENYILAYYSVFFTQQRASSTEQTIL